MKNLRILPGAAGTISHNRAGSKYRTNTPKGAKHDRKLTEGLNKQALEAAEAKEKQTAANADMPLGDDRLSQVSGGGGAAGNESDLSCILCGNSDSEKIRIVGDSGPLGLSYYCDVCKQTFPVLCQW